MLKVLIRLLKARLKVLLKVFMRLLKPPSLAQRRLLSGSIELFKRAR